MVNRVDYGRWVAPLMTIATVGGGSNGIINCLLTLQHVADLQELAVGAIFMAAYCVGTWVGARGLPYNAKRQVIAFLYFLLQVPILQTPVLAFRMYALGAFATVIHPQSLTITFNWWVGSYWELSIRQPVPEIGVGFNAVPLLCMFVLWSMNRWQEK